MKNLKRLQEILEEKVQSLVDLRRWTDIVFSPEAEKAETISEHLDAAQKGVVLAMVALDPLMDQREYNIRCAKYKAVYDFLGVLRGKLDDPEKRAEDITSQIRELEGKITELKESGHNEAAEM